MKTTILLKKNGFQSQIEFVLKSIVRLNFFNLGAFGKLKVSSEETAGMKKKEKKTDKKKEK